MPTGPEPVIAGSRGFALALLAPLTERIGTRPRIAADPAAARTFCAGSGALVVVEFLGPDTLRGIQELLREASGVRVVAAVPEMHAASAAQLRALGVDIARWDGAAGEVVAAVGRQLAGPAQGGLPRVAVQPRAAAPTPVAHPPVVAAVRIPTPVPTARAAMPVPAARTAPAVPSLPAAPRPVFSEQVSAALTPPPWLPPPPPEAAPSWPASVPGEVEAADALDRAISGAAPSPDAALAVVPDVVAALSDIERDVLAGAGTAFDPEPIRRAAVMRVRVAAALASVPAAGSDVDTAAVSALLAEIDGLLSRVNELAAGAAPEVQAALEVVRGELVREAIDFSEAAQRASPEGAVAEAAPRPRSASRRDRTRLLSVDDRPDQARRTPIAIWILLAVAVAIAGGYHGWNWYVRRATRAAMSTGLPAGLMQMPGPAGGPRVLVQATATDLPDAAEVAKLKAAEEAKGNVVRESGGAIFIEAAPHASGPPASPVASPPTPPAPSP